MVGFCRNTQTFQGHPSPMRLTACALAVLVVSVGCLGSQLDDVEDRTRQATEGIERQLTPDDQGASEVSIAADPTDPSHLVAAANSEGGFGVYVSRDAGQSWEVSRFEPSDVGSGQAAGFQAISDPVVAFGPGGTVYLAGLAYLPTSAVFVAESRDGGQTWDEVHFVHESDPAVNFNDKEWLAVNPESGTLVMSWQMEPAVDQLRSVEGLTGADVDIGDIVVSRSTDGGESWTEPAKISRGMHSNGTQVAIGRDGTVYALWVNYETNTLDHAKSTDDGETFSDPEPVADVDTVPAYARYSRMHTLPALAVSEDGHAVYAVWHDNRTGDADVRAVASFDGGKTWAESVRVTDDEPGNGVLQVYPWATVGPDDRLHVSFYDTRQDPGHPKLAYYHTAAAPGSLDFGPDRMVSNRTFTAFAEPGCGGPQGDPCEGARSLGDYTGITASQAGVFPAWADGRGDTSRVFAGRLALP